MRRLLIALLSVALIACSTINATLQTKLAETIYTKQPTLLEEFTHLGLKVSEVETLSSLRQIEGYPLYTMHYSALYDNLGNIWPSDPSSADLSSKNDFWACSLFTALADSQSQLYGRNFDWEFSPGLLLYVNPPKGYASISMVDIAYLGFAGEKSKNLTEKPLEELVSLLNAPYLPFDGVNEAGLAIGMAAVPSGDVPLDPEKVTLGSLEIIRVVLDSAANVDHALEIMQNYNIDFEGGPSIHYLLADTQGNSALLEHYNNQVYVFRNQNPWQQATNFLQASVDSPNDQCARYDVINEKLEASKGTLTPEAAMGLLKDVAQSNTQWSVVYDMSRKNIHIVMGRNYKNEHVLPFVLSNQ